MPGDRQFRHPPNVPNAHSPPPKRSDKTSVGGWLDHAATIRWQLGIAAVHNAGDVAQLEEFNARKRAAIQKRLHNGLHCGPMRLEKFSPVLTGLLQVDVAVPPTHQLDRELSRNLQVVGIAHIMSAARILQV